MSDELLLVADLCAGYGPGLALHDLNLVVAQGEVVVILGANGAGKTTTMRAISGTVSTTGSIRFDGQELVGRKPESVARLGVAHVPQGRGTFAEMTVSDNLDAGAYIRRDRVGVQLDRDRWFEVFPVLARRRSQPAGQLSGGEQQMLAVVRALMGRPRLLLLDEPSLGLAPMVIRDLFDQLTELNRHDGLTLLIVEQNLDVALRIAHRGYVLETGEIKASGTADQLATDDAVRRAYLGQ